MYLKSDLNLDSEDDKKSFDMSLDIIIDGAICVQKVSANKLCELLSCKFTKCKFYIN